MTLATLTEVKTGLRIDHDDDDATLTLLTEAASEAILAYLKVEAVDVVPSRVKQAAILLVSKLYEPGDKDPFEGAKLPTAVRALMHSMRTPTVA